MRTSLSLWIFGDMRKKIKKLILIIGLILLPFTCEAAIAVDDTSSKTRDNKSSITWTHTCTGSNLILVVSLAMRDGKVDDRNVGSVTYNGTALTKAVDLDDAGNLYNVEIWYLVNPDTGSAYDIVASNVSGEACTIFTVGAVSLTGVDQTTGLDASNSDTGTGSPTVDVTTIADDCYLVDSMYTLQHSGGKVSVGANQVEIQKTDTGNTTCGASYEAGGSAGAHTMSWVDIDNDEHWLICAASFKEVGAAPPAIAVKPIVNIF